MLVVCSTCPGVSLLIMCVCSSSWNIVPQGALPMSCVIAVGRVYGNRRSRASRVARWKDWRTSTRSERYIETSKRAISSSTPRAPQNWLISVRPASRPAASGSPAAQAKIDVLGVAGQLSDAHAKRNTGTSHASSRATRHSRKRPYK